MGFLLPWVLANYLGSCDSYVHPGTAVTSVVALL